MIDVYDYPGTLGASPTGTQESHFEREEMRVKVVESHRYEPKRGMWTMRQQFEVEGPEGTGGFEAVHQLRIRTMDEYAQALEAAGFTILEALAAYPNTPQRYDTSGA